jgi:hypothetical protein
MSFLGGRRGTWNPFGRKLSFKARNCWYLHRKKERKKERKKGRKNAKE